MSNTTCAMPDRRPTAAEILDTPLPDLLAGLGVDAYSSQISDRTFFGALGTRSGGQLFLTLPSGRSDFETDTTARYLLAKAFDVELPDLPPPFTTTEI
ncbi:hypothetical protein OG864_45225 [Streptomyces sp. NBC_00124]|uniref:hypothetical protein n=1 Tax=Streptomyces sp. NBC_00124 TaxID=2975662 RepID=UPI0022521A9C|nr:hypothetical protein [Streptomyces sp. NBC_00124]MCX5365905.1 hypothetical protein [Streptomyces sp. NBC_00124]